MQTVTVSASTREEAHAAARFMEHAAIMLPTTGGHSEQRAAEAQLLAEATSGKKRGRPPKAAVEQPAEQSTEQAAPVQEQLVEESAESDQVDALLDVEQTPEPSGASEDDMDALLGVSDPAPATAAKPSPYADLTHEQLMTEVRTRVRHPAMKDLSSKWMKTVLERETRKDKNANSFAKFNEVALRQALEESDRILAGEDIAAVYPELK